MTTLKISKVLSALPDPLEADKVYAVRVGTGFDLYITDHSGLIAYKQNAPSLGGPVTALTNSSGTVNVDLSKGDYFTLALGANVTALTFSNLPAAGTGRTIDLTLTQDATGSRTFALPSSFKAIGNSDTAIQSAANARTKIIATTLDAGTTWAYSMAKVNV